ncbi:MAG: nucleotidyl transferase AbiEii/AbiGii toxin family protein [Chloroflexi bacterium]|nr:nucleotidyl transferase AbiEii/AbiGii toxin family protein [Chloroflexota bacterium]
MTRLFWNTVTENMRLVMNGFTKSELGKRFYLAGGTALSLQMGHRHSIDLDFFSQTEDIPTLRPHLEKTLSQFNATLADSSWGNLVYLANNTRVGFYGYGYSLVEPLKIDKEVHLASILDIALMKLDALLSRAARKDFYDLYFICQSIPLRKIFDSAPQKYPSVRDFEAQTLKRLVYFENAEQETDLQLIKYVNWNTVKEYFIEQAKKIEKSWLK